MNFKWNEMQKDKHITPFCLPDHFWKASCLSGLKSLIIGIGLRSTLSLDIFLPFPCHLSMYGLCTEVVSVLTLVGQPVPTVTFSGPSSNWISYCATSFTSSSNTLSLNSAVVPVPSQSCLLLISCRTKSSNKLPILLVTG